MFNWSGELYTNIKAKDTLCLIRELFILVSTPMKLDLSSIIKGCLFNKKTKKFTKNTSCFKTSQSRNKTKKQTKQSQTGVTRTTVMKFH